MRLFAGICLVVAILTGQPWSSLWADGMAAEPAARGDEESQSPEWAWDECCDDFWQPRWTARVGAVLLQRGRPKSTPFVLDSNTGNPIIDPSNFVSGFNGGADVDLIRHGDVADFELRYFGVNAWSASQGPFNVGPGAELAVIGTGVAPDPMTISSGLVSALQSAEANLRRNVTSRLTLLAGFRYVSFRDRLSLLAVDNVAASTTAIGFNTNNNLFGFQVGADDVLWTADRFRIEGAVKAGVFGNAAASELTISSNGGPNFGISSQRDQTAVVGELIFTGVYSINDTWAVRAGYELLWLSGVAVASEQLHETNFNTGQFPTNTTHAAFFHGALLGAEASW